MGKCRQNKKSSTLEFWHIRYDNSYSLRKLGDQGNGAKMVLIILLNAHFCPYKTITKLCVLPNFLCIKWKLGIDILSKSYNSFVARIKIDLSVNQ